MCERNETKREVEEKIEEEKTPTVNWHSMMCREREMWNPRHCQQSEGKTLLPLRNLVHKSENINFPAANENSWKMSPWKPETRIPEEVVQWNTIPFLCSPPPFISRLFCYSVSFGNSSKETRLFVNILLFNFRYWALNMNKRSFKKSYEKSEKTVQW